MLGDLIWPPGLKDEESQRPVGPSPEASRRALPFSLNPGWFPQGSGNGYCTKVCGPRRIRLRRVNEKESSTAVCRCTSVLTLTAAVVKRQSVALY